VMWLFRPAKPAIVRKYSFFLDEFVNLVSW
jgi:hypothetical protein